MDLIQCPHCLHLNLPSATICEACGTELVHEAANEVFLTGKLPELEVDPVEDVLPDSPKTRQVDPGPEENMPRWGGAQIEDTTQVVAFVLHYNQTLTVDIHQTGSVLLGRMEESESETPCLDLSEFEATEAGVSRQHARFDLKDFSLYIVDLSSTNGTYLNGLRILPNQPRVLRDGDEIRLGQLRLQILYINPNGEADS